MKPVSAARLREAFTAAALFLATAAFTLWQNSRIAVLWDLTYLLDSSYRIRLGQMPYRDFPFAHAPLTFLLHAAIIRLFGRVFLPHIVCAAVEAGAATVLTWRMLLVILRHDSTRPSLLLGTLLAAPLTVLGIYAIYPHPIYDSDAILAVLAALYSLLRAGESRSRSAVAGAACVLPLFFKQNIGLAFPAAVLASIALLAILRRLRQDPVVPQLAILASAAATLAAVLFVLHCTAGLHNYFYWTISFAAQRRLPGLRLILQTYHQPALLWTIPASAAGVALLVRKSHLASQSRAGHLRRLVGLLLLASPFLWAIAFFAITSDPDDRADQLLSLWPHLLLLGAAFALWRLRPSGLRAEPNLLALLPLILLATIHGTFLSQQLWGSTYALWPLLLLLIAAMLAAVPSVARPLAIVISATLLICGSLYSASLERLSYIHQDGTEAHATIPALHGLTTPGPWIPGFEELVRYTDAAIPANDGILLLPGEDPFYFATGRTPEFPILLFDPATDPYTPQQTVLEAREHNIRWLIVSHNLQLTELPQPDLPQVLAALQQDFAFDRTIANFDIYRRKP